MSCSSISTDNVNVTTDNVNVTEKYAEVFEGLDGCLKNFECHLTLKSNVLPTCDAPRKIPFHLKEPLKQELNNLEEMQVIQKVNEPTEWVNSIVLVTKKNGKLRICLDARKLNKAILRSHFQFPNIEDIKSELAGSQYYSVLDANSGFWMLRLDEESSKACTFITSEGTYRRNHIHIIKPNIFNTKERKVETSRNETAPINYRKNANSCNLRSVESLISTLTTTPQEIGPYPKATPRKQKAERKPDKTTIVTDTPEKLALKEEYKT
ncbi:hypothetical protein QE152_g24398 [Popillia japonica]|uniref:Reverse transcriptase domain-containing protein n=1 Tax=Popillia japonica TaxID=7064 RepID=A0AAW1KFT2_POPJA